jgi:hypothetical protein
VLVIVEAVGCTLTMCGRSRHQSIHVDMVYAIFIYPMIGHGEAFAGSEDGHLEVRAGRSQGDVTGTRIKVASAKADGGAAIRNIASATATVSLAAVRSCKVPPQAVISRSILPRGERKSPERTRKKL